LPLGSAAIFAALSSIEGPPILPNPPDETPHCVKLNTIATKPAKLIHLFSMRTILEKFIRMASAEKPNNLT
jgi:hypothetical protein